MNTNIEPEINLNINTLNFYNEQDNRIHNWIFKEKKSKDFKKGLNDELFFEEKTNNKDFQNYKLSKQKNKIKYDMEKKKMKEIINIERAKKLKGISAGRINFKSNTKKGEVIKSKLNKIKLSVNKKIKSTPKQNVILRTSENRIKNKYKLFIE